jgi:hypothetical protein
MPPPSPPPPDFVVVVFKSLRYVLVSLEEEGVGSGIFLQGTSSSAADGGGGSGGDGQGKSIGDGGGGGGGGGEGVCESGGDWRQTTGSSAGIVVDDDGDDDETASPPPAVDDDDDDADEEEEEEEEEEEIERRLALEKERCSFDASKSFSRRIESSSCSILLISSLSLMVLSDSSDVKDNSTESIVSAVRTARGCSGPCSSTRRPSR